MFLNKFFDANPKNKLELARFLTLLRIQDRVECGKGTELHWGAPHRKKLIQGGGTYTYFLDGAQIKKRVQKSIWLGG